MEELERCIERKQTSNDTANETLIDRSNIILKINHSIVQSFLLSTTIEPLLFAVMVADGLSGPVTTNFIMQKCCEVHFNNNKSICSATVITNTNETNVEEILQPCASLVLTGMNLLSIFFPVILSLFLGAWSDQNGRKLLLIVPTIGFSMKYLLLALFSLIPNLHPGLLLLTVLPVSLTGGFVNFITAAYSYICDISEKNNVSIRIGILEGFMLIGGIIGNLCSSHLYDSERQYPYLVTFGVSTIVTFFAAILNYIFLKESLSKTDDGKGIKHIFDIQLLKDMFKICFKQRESYGRTVIFLVILSLTLTICALEGESNLRFLYTRLKFNWSIEEYTNWISLTYGINFLGFIFGSFLLVKWLKMSDALLGTIASALFAAGDIFIAFVPSKYPYMLYFEGLIKLFTAFFCPSARALLSKSVPEEDLGKVFALTTSSESVFPLVITPIYTLLYNSTIDILPGAFFLLSSSFFILNIVIFIIINYLIKITGTTQYKNCNDQARMG